MYDAEAPGVFASHLRPYCVVSSDFVAHIRKKKKTRLAFLCSHPHVDAASSFPRFRAFRQGDSQLVFLIGIRTAHQKLDLGSHIPPYLLEIFAFLQSFRFFQSSRLSSSFLVAENFFVSAGHLPPLLHMADFLVVTRMRIFKASRV